MGQRLVVNISRNHKIISSTYFHWSGYTPTTFEIVSKMIANIESIHDIKTIHPLKLSYLAFEGVENDVALDETEKDAFIDYDKNAPEYILVTRTPNRNDGLLFVTQEGAASNAGSGEMTVEINLDNKTVMGDILYISEPEYEPDVMEALELPYDPHEELSYEEFQELADFYLSDENVQRMSLLYKGVIYGQIV